MESKFDPTHKVTTANLVSLPQEVKNLMLEEGEMYVPSEGYSKVRLHAGARHANRGVRSAFG
eukprot:5275939-Prymnesium_polylepis.1